MKLIGFALVLGVVELFANNRPNFLFIVADDLGYADVGFHGSTVVDTPNLDRLAQNGVIFKNGYVTHPYCGPSRAGLITGRYQARFGMEINLSYSPYDLHQGLPLDEKTFAERLKPAGYQTGMIGKWHLGAAEPYHPNNRGFNYFYGFLSGGHDYFPSMVTTHPKLLTENGQPHYSNNEGGTLPLLRNMNTAEFEEYLTTALSKDAARFVSESEDPFCLYLAYNAPHGPLHAPQALVEKYRKREPDLLRATYLAMIDSMDQGIGLVVDALEQSGKLENTLIFFLSDNGGVYAKAGYKQETWADNTPFRDGKGSMREGGSHVPFIAHWPQGFPKGITYSHLVSSLDLAATAVALAGGDASGKPMDGVNLEPYLNRRVTGIPHKALFWRAVNGATWCVRTPEAKLFPSTYGSEDLELYDMINDPYESTNLIDERLEQRLQLASLWNEWNAKNEACYLLQAYDYQKERMRMYRDLHDRLKKNSTELQPKVVK
ncbi:MAG: Arylsulfatase [Opitutia bacterium UBA7350]|nr:MAG: Arylsulfatase [Opitutae bacterium UBA7350]